MKIKKKEKTIGDVKRQINAMRDSKRKNPDGSVSTHKMAWSSGEGDNDAMVYPTIFPGKNGQWIEYGGDEKTREQWNSTIDEAANRGEIISGLSNSIAEDIAAGSWKNMGMLDIKKKQANIFKQGGKMKLKKYGMGGTNPPQKKPTKKTYGPPKPPGYKEPTAEEKKMSADEKRYLSLREQAEREYRMVLKEGGTEAQAEKAANKILDGFKSGGMMKLKKKC